MNLHSSISKKNSSIWQGRIEIEFTELLMVDSVQRVIIFKTCQSLYTSVICFRSMESRSAAHNSNLCMKTTIIWAILVLAHNEFIFIIKNKYSSVNNSTASHLVCNWKSNQTCVWPWFYYCMPIDFQLRHRR